MSAGWMVLHTALLFGMALLALSLLWIRRLMAAVVVLTAFSLMMALEFYILQAPDVAIAEAGIGAGLTTAIFIITIVATRGRKPSKDPDPPEEAA